MTHRPLMLALALLAGAHAQAQQGGVAPVTVDRAEPASQQRMQPLPPLPSEAAAPAAPEPAAAQPTEMGSATRHLLALQRSGAAASAVPRPLPGDVAQRSRERYLKSFEHPIPEHFQSSVGGKSGQGAGGR
ncbi:DUF3613 domain-containing protein [Xenophilus arseniciresistens]|uniref:DUF3613 domain-containing protein n=1 Tax=Xenophilus arseniciresistens TaxID=1283306 RepID=A0AAE3NEJ5_9BURK|nr:DUF3613 domain-containing protein [Xenophilus arseniciresistens]MDA7418169.1 DUF3613 domain-containing protein [Xenophilus arseniciresistens]